MNMKRLLTLVAFFATLHASAQQVNPVPDYVFANRMSAGRNTVTDTAAYFSIGPRYGATRGMMPPMVVDTASFSANKRNGLLIFSVQKNKFLYWDSVGVKWAEMAGTGGSAIAGTGTTNYIPKFTGTTTIGNSQIFDNGVSVGIGTSSLLGKLTVVDTGNVEIYAAGSSNGNAILYLDAAGTGTAQVHSVGAKPLSFFADANERLRIYGNGNIFVGSSPTDSSYLFDISGTLRAKMGVNLATTGGVVSIGTSTPISGTILDIVTASTSYQRLRSTSANESLILFQNSSTGTSGTDGFHVGITSGGNAALYNYENTSMSFFTNNAERFRLFANGRAFFGGTPSDAGYQVDINGTLRTVNGANFATTSGNVGIGTTAPLQLFTVKVNSSETVAIQDQGGFAGIVFKHITTGAYRDGTIDAGNLFLQSVSNGEVRINTTSDAGDYKLQVSGNIYNTGSLTTGAPSGGSIKPWKIGEAATVSPTSPNRTLRVEVDGVVYYIHAKTTND